MKRGFTLIELLAVIVILAIIALIAVPIVIGIINDSKKSSEKESIKLYLDTVQKMVTKRQMSIPKFKPTECTINGKKITCDEEEIEIEMKGKMPESGTITFDNGMLISGINLKLNGLYYQVNKGEVSDGTKDPIAAVGEICTGGGKSTTIGTKYSCEVKPGKSFNFYVLSKDGDNVNLIMERNICSSYPSNYPNGEPARGYYSDHDEHCSIDWIDDNVGNDSSNYGPTGVMKGLYVATKDWINVPDMIMDYVDEAIEHYGENDSYATIITDTTTKVTTITGKQDEYTDGVPVTTIGTISEPLKARLPMFSEVTSEEVGCVFGGDSFYDQPSIGSCEPWLVNYLSDESIDKYELNQKLDNIYGYWLLSSASYFASRIYSKGYVHSIRVLVQDDYTGIRPVITVPTSALGN